jgi:hypothetical protein
MPASFAKQHFPALDVKKCNDAFCAAVPKGAIRVESIATCMGCVLATCVGDVENLPKIAKGMAEWAQPIIKANEAKLTACVEYRKQVLEPEHAVSNLGEQVLKMVMADAQKHQQGLEMEDEEIVMVKKMGEMMVYKAPDDNEEYEKLKHRGDGDAPLLVLGGDIEGPDGWFKHLYRMGGR